MARLAKGKKPLDQTVKRPPFQFVGGSLALDFVNTVGSRLGRPRDYFAADADVEKWCSEAGLVTGRPKELNSSAKLSRVRTLREVLYRIFSSIADGGRPSKKDLGTLNRELARYNSLREIRRVRGQFVLGWSDTVSRADLILGPVILEAGMLLIADSLQQVRRCGDSECGWLFIDRSQGRRRKWCSMSDCGNRAKGRRYYRRMSGGDGR